MGTQETALQCHKTVKDKVKKDGYSNPRGWGRIALSFNKIDMVRTYICKSSADEGNCEIKGIRKRKWSNEAPSYWVKQKRGVQRESEEEKTQGCHCQKNRNKISQ